ncbi:MAG TPA: ATP synthase F1 subunit gamma [Armatimonadota bacterium]|nr:ATP synthase F1 subunit gamma [Armatimonadota bacterium]
MLSTRDIQRKIRTVRNIQQICRAMKTVSSIKLRKAEERILAARPYADALRTMVMRLGAGGETSHPLLQTREVEKAGVIAISADKGLAGSFNTNLLREAIALAKSTPDVRVIPIGRKIADAYRREDFDIYTSLAPLGNEAEFRTIAAIADQVGADYIAGVFDRVDLIYTQYGGRVTTMQLLPIQPPEGEEASGSFIFEPNPEAILEQLMPRYLRTVLFTAVLSSIAAEHAARVAAMSLATDNADDLISRLTMDYNKSRQSSITGELTDIVGAAEALK